MPASGRKKPKWSGKSLKAQATVSPLARSSASKSVPSVARMNFALALAVAGLCLERLERLRHLPCVAGQDVDVVGLENAAEVGLVRRPRAKALDRRLLVAEGFKEGIREARGVERLLRKVGNGLFDLNGVQLFAPLCGRRFSLFVLVRFTCVRRWPFARVAVGSNLICRADVLAAI